jgi:hypothetical protein
MAEFDRAVIARAVPRRNLAAFHRTYAVIAAVIALLAIWAPSVRAAGDVHLNGKTGR